jgi:hypothetical protein
MADLGTPEREGVFLVVRREEQTGARGRAAGRLLDTRDDDGA